jgi:hypothetical protein
MMLADPSPLRRSMYTLLITIATAVLLGRIVSAQLLYEPSLSAPRDGDPDYPRRAWPSKPPRPMPTFSSNDRSRWATIRALVDEGTYVIGHRDPERATATNPYGDEGIVFEDGWQTVDKVLKPETNEFYSSKPPLLPTLLAGEYWLLKKLFGWSIADNPWLVVCTILLTVNWLPWIVYLVLMARLCERFGRTDWGRLFVLSAACFATMLTPFAITLNNHTIAAWSLLVALYAVLPPIDTGNAALGYGRLAVAGFFASFAACNDLPATAFAVGLLVVLLLWRARPVLLAFVPAAIVPVAAFFATNYLAVGELAPVYSKIDSGWYQYKGSHWKPAPDKPKRGIDWAGTKENRLTYAANVLVGHHGVFSLTPINWLAAAGMVLGVGGLWRSMAGRRGGPRPSAHAITATPATPQIAPGDVLAAGTLVLTVLVTGFYLWKTNNYGGWTNGPRWLLWLTPLWLLTMLPVTDWLGQRRWGRILALSLLALSVLSAHYWDWNPWRHPWIYNWMDGRGWIPY